MSKRDEYISVYGDEGQADRLMAAKTYIKSFFYPLNLQFIELVVDRRCSLKRKTLQTQKTKRYFILQK